MSSLIDALLAIHDVLEANEIGHALCGGIAANLYRKEVRATVDVDICIAVSAAHLIELTHCFEAEGWQAHPYWREWDLVRLDKANLPRVDCLIASTLYEKEAVARAAPASIEGRKVPVLRAEDLIVFKLVAGRARDYEAVAAIINTQGDKLDESFIVETLTELGFEDRWRRAKDEAAREAESF